MKVNEDLSILFWLKRQKATKEGLVPIYVGVSEICYTLFRGKIDHLFAGKEMQPML